jgi:triphosphatase
MAGRRSAPPAPPAAAREIELKLLLRPQDLPALRARLDRRAAARVERVDSTYYDTPDLRLAAAQAALRLRSIERGRRRVWVQTFKTDDRQAALAARGEWETPAPHARIDPVRLDHAPLAQLLGGRAACRELAPRFRTVFERTAWELLAHGAHIEAVIDVGEIQAGGRVEAICEAELELRSGEPAALFELALELSGSEGAGRGTPALSLVPYGASKAARGLRLALGRAAPEPVPGLPKGRGDRGRSGEDFEPDQPLGRAARLWLGRGAEALLANAAGALLGDDPEFVHQARVALRFMRVGLELLGPGLAGGERLAPAQARGLQAWAREFGAVRDWDVLCEEMLPSLAREAGKGGEARWARVREAAQRKRLRARARLRRRLQAPAFAEFALRLLLWIAREPREEDGRLDEFAHAALRQRRRRLSKAARGFAKASMARQHKIRLQAKSLRYGIETLRAVLPGAVRKSDLRLLSRFQDAAGCARDLALAGAELRGLTRARPLLRQIEAWSRAQKRAGLGKAQRLAAHLQRW